MAATAYPKSILKPPRTNPLTGLPIPSPDRALQIALSHAHSLAIRKALEFSLLASLETLLDYPDAPGSSAVVFKHHLRFFTPADYDSLLEERNIADRCGYTLCARPKRRDPGKHGNSKYVLVDRGRRNQRFIERRLVERFCDDVCARRALWIRVQLREEPAWMRADIVTRARLSEMGVVSGILGLNENSPQFGWVSDLLLLEEVEERQRRDGEMKKAADDRDMRRLIDELEGLGIDSSDLRIRNQREGDEMSISFRVDERMPAPDVAVTAPQEEQNKNGDDDDGDEDKEDEDKMDLDERLAAMTIDGYMPRGSFLGNTKR